jgi:hypothetical protein
MSSNNWLCTLNNPDVDTQEYLAEWFKHCTYVCGQLERGEEGTPHIQFYLCLKSKSRMAALKKLDKRAHFQMVKFDNGASDYCLKEESRVEGPYEFGLKPCRKNVKGDTKARNQKILEIGVEECVS